MPDVMRNIYANNITGVTDVTISNIPQTGKHLIMYMGAPYGCGYSGPMYTNSTTSYDYIHNLFFNANSVSGTNNDDRMRNMWWHMNPNANYKGAQLFIPFYSDSGKFKSVLAQGGSFYQLFSNYNTLTYLATYRPNSDGAITSIQISGLNSGHNYQLSVELIG